jgi:hypothetical protein
VRRPVQNLDDAMTSALRHSHRACLLAAIMGLALAAPAAGADRPGAVALTPGEAAFWSGPPAGGSACTGDEGPCWEYALDVAPGGWRLRIAIDRPSLVGKLTVDVVGPGGGSASFEADVGLYSAESFVSPRVGRWRLRVTPADVSDPRFRMRAKLERAPAAVTGKTPVPPNLQAAPPYLFSFQLPVTNGTSDPPAGLSLPGGRASCHPEEVAEERALRCLRMAFGVRNTGQGPMDLEFDDPGEPHPDRPLFQRVTYSDGTSATRAAGLATYHETHRHYHQKDAVAVALLAVADPRRGRPTPAGAEHRKGFHHRNELLREWSHFYPVWPARGGEGSIALAAGWGDYYEWDRPGNYVDFGINPDGYYVVRLTADPAKAVLESNEQDNVSYSLIRVTGDRIELLESGRGADPWDRCKIVVPFGPEPNPPPGDRGARPADCPPDTVWPAEPAATRAATPRRKRKAKAKPRCKGPRRGAAREQKAAKKKKRAKCRRTRRGESR